MERENMLVSPGSPGRQHPLVIFADPTVLVETAETTKQKQKQKKKRMDAKSEKKRSTSTDKGNKKEAKRVRFTVPVPSRKEIVASLRPRQQLRESVLDEAKVRHAEKEEDNEKEADPRSIATLRRMVLPEAVIGRPHTSLRKARFMIVLELDQVLFQASPTRLEMTAGECVSLYKAGRQRQCRDQWLRFRPHLDLFLRFLFKLPELPCKVGIWTHLPMPDGHAELDEWIAATFGRFASRIHFRYTQLDTLGANSTKANKKEADSAKKDLNLLAREIPWPRERILLIDYDPKVVCPGQEPNVYLLPRLQFCPTNAFAIPLQSSFEFHLPLIYQQCLRLEK